MPALMPQLKNLLNNEGFPLHNKGSVFRSLFFAPDSRFFRECGEDVTGFCTAYSNFAKLYNYANNN